MAKAKVFDVLGKDAGTVELNKNIFEVTPQQQSMFDVVLSERASQRTGNHKTKTRREVSGGGIKPWRQKGTGRARHGSIRSPIWRGGGTVFGPTPAKNYTIKINKKARLMAYKSAWTIKKDDIKVLDKIEFSSPSTRDFTVMLKNLKLDKSKVLFIIDIDQVNVWKSANNIPKVLTTTEDYILVEDILGADKILTTKEVFEKIQGRFDK